MSNHIDLLDASALIAFIRKEKGYEKIEKLFLDAEKRHVSIFIHQINFIEFLYKIEQIYGHDTFRKIIADLQSPFLGVMNYMDSDLAMYCGHLKSKYHLSLADATGLSYSKIIEGVFWTGDRALLPVATEEKIELQLFR